jgi:hypothetical protein
MQAHSQPSTAPHFVLGDKVAIVTKNLFFRGELNRKLRNRHVGPFTFEEQIGKHGYIFQLPTRVRLHPVFHVNNLRPYSTVSLRLHVPATVSKGDDEEFDV